MVGIERKEPRHQVAARLLGGYAAFAGADPELITALALWLLHDLVERLKRAGTVEMAGPGAVQKIPLEALLKQLKHGTGG